MSKYYGVVAWDTEQGGHHTRLWESREYRRAANAEKAIANELATGPYPETGRLTYVVEVRPLPKDK